MRNATRLRHAVLALVAAAALGACSSGMTVKGSVHLGPGGRAEGRLGNAPGESASITLENEGPGRADFVVRHEDGTPLMHGALQHAESYVQSTEAEMLVVVLEAYADSGTTISYVVRSKDGAGVRWELSEAHGGGALTTGD